MSRKISEWGAPVIAYCCVIAVNALANALPIGGRTTGDVSAQYENLFTPAGYTFSIWGLIYLGIGAYVVYQALPARRDSPVLAKASPVFVINCVANIAWIFAWHYELLFLSLVLIIVMLVTLVRIYRILGIGTAPVPAGFRWFVHVPFSLYTGWITVATIANASVVQVALDWHDAGTSAVNWTLLKLAVAGAIAATVAVRRGDIVFVLVVGWAALGIAVNQSATPAVSGAATVLSLVAVLLAVGELARRFRRTR